MSLCASKRQRSGNKPPVKGRAVTGVPQCPVLQAQVDLASPVVIMGCEMYMLTALGHPSLGMATPPKTRVESKEYKLVFFS